MRLLFLRSNELEMASCIPYHMILCVFHIPVAFQFQEIGVLLFLLEMENIIYYLYNVKKGFIKQ